MGLAVFIPHQYRSRYSLLDAMAAEIGRAFSAAGAEVNPVRPVRVGEPTLHLFFNVPQNIEQLLAWAQPQRPNAALLQFFVDHPVGLPVEFVERMCAIPSYRLATPCFDERAMLAARWPMLRSFTCGHGVPREALCAPESIKAPRRREIMIAGTIAAPAELAALRQQLPEVLHSPCDAASELLARRSAISFVQALDLCLPATLFASDRWRLLQACSRYVVAKANRDRRLAMLESLNGLPVRVFGPEVWREHCRDTLVYGGEIEYARLAAAMAEFAVVLAWNPTQFTLGHSERVLMGMAAGAATLTDDRPSVHAQLGPAVETYDPRQPESLAELARRLISDPEASAELGAAGRAEVERAHLWEHRVALIGRVVADVLGQSIASSVPGPLAPQLTQ
ncbi:MAG: glycosyltransferase family protein [Phycisphaerales bacterium]